MKHQPGLINGGKNAPALKIDGEDAGTMREGWLQNWPEIAWLLWFRARKWREVAVLLVPVRKWLEIAWLLCGLQHGIRASVPFVNQVRDLFRKKWTSGYD